MSRSLRTRVVVLLGVALSLSAVPARASATFPEALRKKLGLAQIVGPAPGCRLCHQDDLGGLKTATKPLGRSLLTAGAMATNVPSLLAAVTTLENDGTDSDHDGTPDIAELKAGADPNVFDSTDGTPAPPVEEVPLPETGCSLVGSGIVDRAGAWAALAVAVAFGLALSRRRLRATLGRT